MEHFLAQAREAMLENGMNYGHPDIIQELRDLYNNGITEWDVAIGRLSELAYSMDDADYEWMEA